MPDSRKTMLHQILDRLAQDGMLLRTDPRLPSLSAWVAGEPVRGSWWSHPKAHEIFNLAEQVEDHPEILMAKLISGKDTYVHRSLWTEVLRVAESQEPWQWEGLSRESRELFEAVGKAGSITGDQWKTETSGGRRFGALARELESRLLVCGASLHTASGAHVKVLSSWHEWRRTRGYRLSRGSPEAAKQKLETRLERWNETYGAHGQFPWQKPAAKKKQADAPTPSGSRTTTGGSG